MVNGNAVGDMTDGSPKPMLLPASKITKYSNNNLPDCSISVKIYGYKKYLVSVDLN